LYCILCMSEIYK